MTLVQALRLKRDLDSAPQGLGHGQVMVCHTLGGRPAQCWPGASPGLPEQSGGAAGAAHQGEAVVWGKRGGGTTILGRGGAVDELNKGWEANGVRGTRENRESERKVQRQGQRSRRLRRRRLSSLLECHSCIWGGSRASSTVHFCFVFGLSVKRCLSKQLAQQRGLGTGHM